MSITEGLHKGMVIRHEGNLYSIDDFHVAQSGKQKPTVHIKLRSLRTGNPTDRTLEQLGKIDEVPSEMRLMQYLYAAGEEYVFMDTETFEQYPLRVDVLSEAIDFLVEEEVYRFLTVDGSVVRLQLPDAVALTVVDTAPVEHAGGGSSVHKDAKLSSGITVKVPLFIGTGDKIKVKTANREYQGKEH